MSQPRKAQIPRSARNDSMVRFKMSFRAKRGISTPEKPILPRAHSHNDYWRKRPLHDALECGFCSVEADIFLVDDKLLVGHDTHELRPDRTLESLYLEPLRARARQFRGKIYPDAPPMWEVLWESGLDLIGTDTPFALRDFMWGKLKAQE